MNSLHQLYIESIFGIVIGDFSDGVAEFTGTLSFERIKQLVNGEDAVFWQEPEAPMGTMAYMFVPVDQGTRLDFAIDYNFNTIYVA